MAFWKSGQPPYLVSSLRFATLISAAPWIKWNNVHAILRKDVPSSGVSFWWSTNCLSAIGFSSIQRQFFCLLSFRFSKNICTVKLCWEQFEDLREKFHSSHALHIEKHDILFCNTPWVITIGKEELLDWDRSRCKHVTKTFGTVLKSQGSLFTWTHPQKHCWYPG